VFTGTVSFIDKADASGFLSVSGGALVSSIADAQIAMPRDGSMAGLNGAATPRAGSVTLTLWVNGVASGLSCRVSDLTTSCTTAGQPAVQIREGDKVAYGYSATGTDPVTNLRHSIAFFGGS